MEQAFRDTEVRSPPRKDRHMLIDDTVSRHTTTVATPTPTATETSTALYNLDLAPTKASGRRWGSYSIFTLWTNDVHNIANYSFAIGLFALGLGGGHMILSLMIGAVIVCVAMTYAGFMGQKTGVPFPVVSRISFGIRGAQIPAIVRAVIAIVWFGIQTYLASIVFRIFLVAVAPSLDRFDQNSILGLSSLGWICFIGIWAIQIVVLVYGMEAVRRFESLAGPLILVTVGSLALWMLFRTDFSIAWTSDQPASGGEMWRQVFAGAALWMSIYGTLILNFCDFSRRSPSKTAVVRGNFWGLFVNVLAFAVIAFILCGAQFQIDGTIIDSPTDIVAAIPNTLFLSLACLALVIVTMAVNVMANFVAPSYVLSNLAPEKISFRKAGIISACIGVVLLPWNLYDSPVVINYFLGGLGAVLGPLFGIIFVDYWFIRRTKVDVPALYSDSPTGPYYYRKGFNLRAIYALVPAALVSTLFAIVPAFHLVAPFSWFIGAGLAAAIYAVVGDRTRQYVDVSGESIAVDSGHGDH